MSVNLFFKLAELKLIALFRCVKQSKESETQQPWHYQHQCLLQVPPMLSKMECVASATRLQGSRHCSWGGLGGPRQNVSCQYNLRKHLFLRVFFVRSG